jgi:hypothetical protein
MGAPCNYQPRALSPGPHALRHLPGMMTPSYHHPVLSPPRSITTPFRFPGSHGLTTHHHVGQSFFLRVLLYSYGYEVETLCVSEPNKLGGCHELAQESVSLDLGLRGRDFCVFAFSQTSESPCSTVSILSSFCAQPPLSVLRSFCPLRCTARVASPISLLCRLAPK